MAEYYRIKIDDNGKTFVIDEDGNKIPPERHREIASQISETVSQDLFVYIGYSKTKMLYKIGITNVPERREKELGISIYFTIRCDPWGDYSARNLEKSLHYIFEKLGERISGEWFELDSVDLLWLYYIYQNASVTSLENVFSWVSKTIQCIDTVANGTVILKPLHLLINIMDTPLHRWRNGFLYFFQTKAHLAYFEQYPEHNMLVLMIYEAVLIYGFKHLFKGVFGDNSHSTAEHLIEGEFDSLVEDMKNLGIPAFNKEGAS